MGVKRFSKFLGAFEEELNNGLDYYVNEKSEGEFRLSEIRVGLGLSASLGLGNVVKASVKPGLYLILKSKNIAN